MEKRISDTGSPPVGLDADRLRVTLLDLVEVAPELIEIVPLRCAAPTFAETEYAIVAAPVPLDADVSVIQGSDTAAVHEHAPEVASAKLPLPAPDPNVVDPGETL